MPSTVGSLVLTILGTVPALVILVVIFHNPACDFKGSSLLLALAVFCACVSILVGRFLLQPPASREVEAQVRFHASSIDLKKMGERWSLSLITIIYSDGSMWSLKERKYRSNENRIPQEEVATCAVLSVSFILFFCIHEVFKILLYGFFFPPTKLL